MQIEYDALNDVQTNLGKIYEEVQNKINNFFTVIDAIEQDWQGTDAQKYLQVMRNDYKEILNDLNTLLGKYIAYLKNVPELYQQLDQIYSNKFIEV